MAILLSYNRPISWGASCLSDSTAAHSGYVTSDGAKVEYYMSMDACSGATGAFNYITGYVATGYVSTGYVVPGGYAITEVATTTTYEYCASYELPSKKDCFRQKLRNNLLPKTKPYTLEPARTPEEVKARELLKMMVGQEAFRDYLRRGFLTVIGKTGLRYAVYPGMRHTKSFAKTVNGKWEQFEDLCVIFRENGYPPTDSVIMRMLLLQDDEFWFRSLANVSRVGDSKKFAIGSLADELAAVKKKARVAA